jgi:sarcosine oxidase subunit beta
MSMEVTVIGGGIVGLASAYYLEQRGVDTAVFEKSAIGSGNTDRAAGGIRLQFDTPVSIELSRQSIRVWEQFESEFGVDIQYRRPGYLYLARDRETAEQLRESVETQNECGVPSEYITPTEAAEYCPELRTENYVGAAYSETDGFADPHLGLQGFANAAAEAGVDVRTGTPVVDVVRDGADGRATGVETPSGQFSADYVINAAGAWASEVGEMAGIDLPITPFRRQVVVATAVCPLPPSVSFTFDYGQACYFRPERDGNALIGGNFGVGSGAVDPEDYSTDLDFKWAAEALERASNTATYFGPESRIVRGWAGLYAVTPDRHPIIEETVPGFINAVGFSGHGFMQAPATGKVVAELVTDGESSLMDVSMLTNDRFDRGELLHDSHGQIYG